MSHQIAPSLPILPNNTMQVHVMPAPLPAYYPTMYTLEIYPRLLIRTLQSEVLLKSLDVYYFQTFDDWQMIHTDIYFIALHIFLFQIISAILCHVHTNKIPITREILFIYSIHTSTEWPFKSICDVLHFVAEYLHKSFNFYIYIHKVFCDS